MIAETSHSSKHCLTGIIAGALIACLCFSSPCCGAPIYEGFRITSDVRNYGLIVYGLNGSGQIVGSYRREPDQHSTDHPFIWTPNETNGLTGRFLELPAAGSAGRTRARAVSDSGVVVGEMEFSNGWRSVVWRYESSDDETGYNYSLRGAGRGSGVNSEGMFVGSSISPVCCYLNGAWADSTIRGASFAERITFPRQDGNWSIVAGDVNSSGWVRVSTSPISRQPNPTHPRRSYLWRPVSGEVIDIAEALNVQDADADVIAYAMNDIGQVVVGVDSNHYLWTPDATGPGSGVLDHIEGIGVPLDVNNHGVVVGGTGSNGGARIWSAGLGSRSLLEASRRIDGTALSGIDMRSAISINDAGQILVRGAFTEFLFNRVPEPSSFACATVIIGCLYRHRGWTGISSLAHRQSEGSTAHL